MAAIASVFILLFAGASILLISESSDLSQIKIDGNISDWDDIEKISENDSTQVENSNIDIIEVGMNLDSVYLSLYTQTKEPLFISKVTF